MEILERLASVEEQLLQGLNRVEHKLTKNTDVFQFFQDGLSAYKDRHLEQAETDNLQAKWLAKITSDNELRYPHRKIVDFLLSQYDSHNRSFKEVHFSKLAKEARVGKSNTRTYLSLLERKQLIERRHDGYRIFFRIREHAI